MNSNDMLTKINQYRSCYNQVVSTKNELDLSVKSLANIINLQNGAYKLNDNCATGGYLDDLLSKQESVISNIDNIILPNINKIIDDLNNQYIAAKQREELEREVGL